MWLVEGRGGALEALDMIMLSVGCMACVVLEVICILEKRRNHSESRGINRPLNIDYMMIQLCCWQNAMGGIELDIVTVHREDLEFSANCFRRARSAASLDAAALSQRAHAHGDAILPRPPTPSNTTA